VDQHRHRELARSAPLCGEIMPALENLLADLTSGDEARAEAAVPSLAALGESERIVSDTLDALACEDARVQCKAVVEIIMCESAGLDELTLGVLSDHDEVDIRRRLVPQGTLDARQQAGGPVVDVLIEALANLEGEQPGRQRVIHIGQTDRPEVDRVESLERVKRVIRKELAGLLVVSRAVGKRLS